MRLRGYVCQMSPVRAFFEEEAGARKQKKQTRAQSESVQVGTTLGRSTEAQEAGAWEAEETA